MPALFVAVVFAQLGTAFPVSGASYATASRLVSPLVAFVTAWVLVLALLLFAMPLMAAGFAIYTMQLVPPGAMEPGRRDLVMLALALSSVAFFTLLNLARIRWMMWVQSVLTVMAIAALLVFGAGGILFGEVSNTRPLFPGGPWPILAAVVPAYIMYSGVNAITEMGGETADPGRTIPRIMGISIAILVVVYSAITYAIVALLPYRTLAEGSVTDAAAVFMGRGPAIAVMATGAVCAAVTTMNGVIAFISRDIMQIARQGALPAGLARVSERSGTPARAVLVVGAISAAGLVLLAILGEKSAVRVASVVSQGFMLMSILASVAILRLPRVFPERYAAAGFRLRSPYLEIFTIGTIVIFSTLLVIGWIQDPATLLAFGILVATGLAYHLVRRPRRVPADTPLDE